MRDLTKSLISYSWAMSLFGVQQAINALNPSQAAKSFDNVTESAKEEFGDIFKSTFRIGDNIQRGLVDLSFNAITFGGALDPTGITKAALDIGQRTAQTVAQSVGQGGQTGSSGPQQQSTGWGPVPPPGGGRKR